MGSVVMSEVLNDTHPWSSSIDSRTHSSERSSYNPSPYNRERSSTHPSRRASSSQSQSSRPNSSTIAPTTRPPDAPASDASIRASSAHGLIQDSTTQQATPAIDVPHQNDKPPPPSPRLSPSAPRPQTSHRSNSPRADPVPSTIAERQSRSPSPEQSSPSGSPPRIRVRDLQHIQSFAGEDMNFYSTSPDTPRGISTPPQYEISDMPIGDIIEMVAGLLTKITTTNDQHHDHLHRQIPGPDAAANLSATTSSVLAFHGKNVPSITILSYLSRIHKYCPATWEVFLSLLVYFDRMTERVNAGPIQSLRQADRDFVERSDRIQQTSRIQQSSMTAQSERTRISEAQRTAAPPGSSVPSYAPQIQPQQMPSPPLSDSDAGNLSHFFVVDSFNIHRLVISGVTCAAKYFSDIFFTNSRYAKVGGLPLVELNHLELQFLLLNDFRLAVPVEELEAYATMLVEFYAREVVAQRQGESMEGVEMVSR